MAEPRPLSLASVQHAGHGCGTSDGSKRRSTKRPLTPAHPDFHIEGDPETRAIPGSRLVTIKNCGHFAYLECPADVRQVFSDFLRRPRLR